MSDRYKGAILSPTAPTVTSQSAGGIYTLSQQTQYQGQGVWPTAVNYPINNSLRFRSSASAYLNRTPATTTNRQTWTWSGWVKRGTLGTRQAILVTANAGGNDYVGLEFLANDKLVIASNDGSGVEQFRLETNAVFRDPSAWYHIVIFFNTTQATASNRAAIYVNGVLQTYSTTVYMPQNYLGRINTNVQHNHSAYLPAAGFYFDGYLAEVNFIDGVALTPSSFGTTDAYGIWQPIPYTGSYGTNGFYLKFTNTTSTATLGNDFSGNSNTWTVNNISLTAGSTYDSMIDVPTNTNSNTANYSVLNPLDIPSDISVSNGNLEASISTTAVWKTICNTISVSSGKWYAEFSTNNTVSMAGIIRSSWNANIADSRFWTDSLGYAYYSDTGAKYNNSTGTSYGATYTTNDIIGVALDLDNGTLVFYKNGVSQGTAFTGLTGEFKFAVAIYYSPQVAIANFGQRPFSYTPPTGFLPLNTYNLPTPTILDGDQYMDATTYTGTGSTQNITNSGSMQPDWVWIKNRSSTNSHQLTDSVRGVNLALASDLTIAEFTGNINAFNTNGFQLTGATNAVNASGQTYVAWQWRASNAAGVSNTQGTITSTVSANTTAGFSIVTYSGNGTSGATVGHGLGVKPAIVIIKGRNASTGASEWVTQHQSLSGGVSASSSTFTLSSYTSVVYLSGTYAAGAYGFDAQINGASGTYVAYCFSQVAGYSAFGSYTGNGSTDGPFIFTGFRPRWVLIKRTDSGNNWFILDTSRDTFNLANDQLLPNSSAAESTNTDCNIDMVSNGFKLRTALDASNGSGGTYIYYAVAENPFKISRAR